MKQEIFISGLRGHHVVDSLRAALIRVRPRVVGIAAAFVSTDGVDQIMTIFRRCGNPACRLVAGVDNAITHPEALYTARDKGWQVRLGKAPKGIFHPKLIVAGAGFARTGMLTDLSCVYVGSSNLTNGGLQTNVECGFLSSADGCISSASIAFAELWSTARTASDIELRNYSARFAERSRRRKLAEMIDIGIADTRPITRRQSDLLKTEPPVKPAIGSTFSNTAWTGLQSFTGEYRFQIEFPRSAGKVISRLVRRAGLRGIVDVYCPDDETTRSMQYKFYKDNSMFRLNVPNDVPGVDWARKHRNGLALVEKGLEGGAMLRLTILKPGSEESEIIGRSVALGTWGRTTTRLYGWY